MITAEAVTAEIVELHEFFEAWLNGDESADFSRVEDALAPEFTFLPPSGETVDRGSLLQGLREGFGQRQLRIRIQDPAIRWTGGDACLATYEEWHEQSGFTTARRSSVLFTEDEGAPGGLLWHLVHETWLRGPPGD